MIHFTIFGGTEAALTPSLRICLTLFGGTELRRPTIARQILTSKRQGRSESISGKYALKNRCLVVTNDADLVLFSLQAKERKGQSESSCL